MFKLSNEPFQKKESSTFSSGRDLDCLKWKMRLYTKGINEKYRRFMGLFLVLVQDRRTNKKVPAEVLYSFSVLNSSGQKVSSVKCHEGRTFSEMDSWGRLLETPSQLGVKDNLVSFAFVSQAFPSSCPKLPTKRTPPVWCRMTSSQSWSR